MFCLLSHICMQLCFSLCVSVLTTAYLTGGMDGGSSPNSGFTPLQWIQLLATAQQLSPRHYHKPSSSPPPLAFLPFVLLLPCHRGPLPALLSLTTIALYLILVSTALYNRLNKSKTHSINKSHC